MNIIFSLITWRLLWVIIVLPLIIYYFTNHKGGTHMQKMKEFSENLTPEQLERREQLIFHRYYNENNYSFGGVCHFERIPISTLKTLLMEGLADPEEAQNLCPSIVNIYNWCNDFDGYNWYVFGYAVSGKRKDCRISIEGVGSYIPLDKETLHEFRDMFSQADVLEGDDQTPAYCWFD